MVFRSTSHALLSFFFSFFSINCFSITYSGISPEQGARGAPVSRLINNIPSSSRALVHVPVRTSAGGFGVARLIPNSPAGLLKGIVRKNPFVITALSILPFVSDDASNYFLPARPEDIEPSLISSTVPVEGFFTFTPPFVGSSYPADYASHCEDPWVQLRNNSNSLIIERLLCPDGSGGRTALVVTYFNTTVQSCPASHPVEFNGGCVTTASARLLEPTPIPVNTVLDDLGKVIIANPYTLPADTPFQIPTDTAFDIPADTDFSLPRDSAFYTESGNFGGIVIPDFIDTVTLSNASDAFNDRLEQVSSGLFQTVDELAPDFISPEDLASAEAALNALLNDLPFVDNITGEVVDAEVTTDGATAPRTIAPTDVNVVSSQVPQNITVNVPEDDTLSQSEFEASNAKFFQQFATQAETETSAFETYQTSLEAQEKDFLDSLGEDVTDFDTPSLPTFDSIFPTFPVGQCIGIPITYNAGGLIKTTSFDSHCPYYHQYIHPLIFWAVNIFTALYVLHLANSTINRKP